MKLPMYRFGERFHSCAGAIALSALVSIAFYGCGKKDEEKAQAPAQSAPAPQKEQPGTPGTPDSPETPDTPDERPAPPQPRPRPNPPAPQPAPSPAPQNPSMGTPAWGSSPERRAWNAAVISVVQRRMPELDRARDVDTFCPGYRQASASQRQSCWVHVVAAISKFESNFHPADSFREPDGNYSVGLLALSPGECPNAPTLNSLKAPLPNLVCGTNKMASLIGKHGYIDGPADGRGASRYWSTLRAPYKRWDPTRNRYLNLGKRNLILPLVRGYRGRSGAEPLGKLGDAVAYVEGEGYVNAAWLRMLNEEREAFEIAAMPVELDGFGYHDEK